MHDVEMSGNAFLLIVAAVFLLGYKRGKAVNDKLIKKIIDKNPILYF